MFGKDCEREIRELNLETKKDELVHGFINCAENLYGDYGVFKDHNVYYEFDRGVDNYLVTLKVLSLKSGEILAYETVDDGWIYGGLGQDCVRPRVVWGESRHNELGITFYQNCSGEIEHTYFVSW